MLDVFGVFNVDEVKEGLFTAIHDALEIFSKTEENKDVYAIALQLESDVGGITLKYMTKSLFREVAAYYKGRGYKDCQLYGLHRLEYYGLGNFSRIECSDYSEILQYFFDMYYFIQTKLWYGKGIYPKQLKTIDGSNIFQMEEYKDRIVPPKAMVIVPKEEDRIYWGIAARYCELFFEIVIDVIEKLKENTDFIDKTEDFVIYASDHDVSYETFDELFLKTVDKDTYNTLLSRTEKY